MARKPTDLITVSAEGDEVGREISEDLDTALRRAQDRMDDHMRRLDAELVPIYERFAPVDTGRLRRGIESSMFFRGRLVRITVSAVAEREGFDYLPVTRFGHVQRVLRPKKGKFLKAHIHGRQKTPVLLKTVRGYRPPYDWVELATVAAEGLAAAHARALNRDVHLVLLQAARSR